MESIDGEYFQRRQAWRSGLSLRLRLLAQWCQLHNLLSPANASRLADLQRRLLSDDLRVGFVGEMARGKSELINAIFFGNYRHRLLPVGPGHFTQCTLEISHSAQQPAALRLLPADTRTEARASSDWERDPSAWTELALEPQDTQQMARALDFICQKKTTVDAAGAKARSPRWRHALLRLPLPLPAHGMRVVDSPGLNAPGVGAERALDLLPTWDVIVLVLSAGTGLTASELTLWQQHLMDHAHTGRALLVVLNKADELWDFWGDETAIQQRAHQQRLDLASQLGIEPEHIFTVSAQKGFTAKVTGDAALLERSGLPVLESALFNKLMANRQSLWQRSLEHDLVRVRSALEEELSERARAIAQRRAQVLDRATTVKTTLSAQAAHANQQDRHSAKIKAMQSILQRHMHKIRSALQHAAWERSLHQLVSALGSSAGAESVQQAYTELQRTVQTQWEPIARCVEDIEHMMASVLPAATADPAHALPVPGPPPMAPYLTQLDQAIEGHLQFLGNSRLHRLKHADFTRELGGQLHNRVGDIRRQMEIDFGDWYAQTRAHLQQEVDRQEDAAHRGREESRLAAEQYRETLAKLDEEDAEWKKLDAMLEAHFSNLQDANADY